ncbi:TerB family tellurite resistance protein [Streptomyces sp. TRM 70351]|uniref:TerB family tellurite resistance protein n=1 Tax=Streptomyces sp. TRM 70351 TaxID=3116552 RepID=UPI002E7BCC76|nr:TerB family tellurite resistance protein [Streptomyces sp. TRM 70351]MEE1928437.1 TerB family tellurite resistance protein [Streptomyces sp. TRM 70351]
MRTGVRTAWTTVEDGEFFCPACGGDRNYERRTGRRRLEVLGLPLLRRGAGGTVLVCTSCRGRFGPQALEDPTTTRLSTLLHDGVRGVALAVLAAGGAGSEAARRAAVESLHAAGYPDCSAEQLLVLCTALGSGGGAAGGHGGEDSGDDGGRGWDGGDTMRIEIELHATLGPLTPHLAAPGRVNLLLQGARIALADGPYRPAELRVLAALGGALQLGPEETQRLLAAAPERS